MQYNRQILYCSDYRESYCINHGLKISDTLMTHLVSIYRWTYKTKWFAINAQWHDNQTSYFSSNHVRFDYCISLYLACLPLWFSCSGSCVSYSYWEHKLKVTGVLFHYFPYFTHVIQTILGHLFILHSFSSFSSCSETHSLPLSFSSIL